MNALTLVIGNKNYSSWSLRPWLLLRQGGIPFSEVRIPLYRTDTQDELRAWSPSGLVPLLQDGELKVWDSLAIGEYLNERFPERQLWPADRATRAMARSISAEMHAGFGALRQAMSMNIRSRYPNQGRTPESLRDIARIQTIWNDCRSRYGAEGEFLFGRFSIADAMYAPVVLRFQTYAVALDGAARDYAETMLTLPTMQEWIAAAMTETERIEMFEVYE